MNDSCTPDKTRKCFRMMIATVAHRPHVFTVAVLVATAICAATARAEVVSLDGIWQAEVAQDAQGDALPAAFTRTIPVPGHWPLMKPSAPCGKKEALWCRTTWKVPDAIPPRATLRIGMASFGTTVFVNGKRAGFLPYNFVPSETDIRPFLKAGAENEIVVRLGNAWMQNSKGAPMAHTGKDNERSRTASTIRIWRTWVTSSNPT